MSRIIITIGGAPWMWHLAHELEERLPNRVVGIVIENTYSMKNKMQQMKKRINRYGIVSTIDQVMLYLYQNIVKTSFDDFCKLPALQAPIFFCGDINHIDCAEFIRSYHPDFVINIGGGIMRPHIFEIPNVCTINLHTGITPRYRGVNANFWALYEGDIKNIGVTVHKVDRGIDTGQVFSQDLISIGGNKETIEEITIRAYRAGIKCVSEVVFKYETMKLMPLYKEPALPAHTYGWYGLSHYLKVKEFLKKLQ